MKKKRVLVFNSGSGSGFQELVENSQTNVLNAQIVGLVTNSHDYGCVGRARRFNMDPCVIEKLTPENYQTVLNIFMPDFVVLSGWLKKLPMGIFDPQKTINIHPGPLPNFGGKGMYGHHVHEAVIKAYKNGYIKNSEVCMHFVTDEYDKGPVFFRYPVLIRPEDTPYTLGSRINKIEHGWQSFVTNLVVTGKIHWDGKNPESMVVPDFMKMFL